MTYDKDAEEGHPPALTPKDGYRILAKMFRRQLLKDERRYKRIRERGRTPAWVAAIQRQHDRFRNMMKNGD